jgi:hypothetical protein
MVVGQNLVRWGWVIANYSTLPVHVLIQPVELTGPIFYQGSDSGSGKTLTPNGVVIAPGETGVFFDGEATRAESSTSLESVPSGGGRCRRGECRYRPPVPRTRGHRPY